MKLALGAAREMFTAPATWVYLLLICGGMATGAVLAGWAQGLDQTFDVSALSIAADLATIVIIVGASMMAAAPYSRGSIGFAYLSDNNRGLDLVFRLLLIVGALVLAGIVGMVGGYLGLTLFGAEVDLSSFSDRANGGGFIWTALLQWTVLAALAAGTAIALRNGVWAVVIWMADFFFIEGMLSLVGADWARALLGVLPVGLTRLVGLGEYPVVDQSVPLAVGILVAWVIAVSVVASVIVRRRPVE
ncbi:hypothetical protein QP027_06840 [Corynebacterium breve]|uniref:ABC transporter permease n=1 Tax=Corynebacterium breve TaxID=3049799 RepID=A0ABY8VDN6_9CORY|nr:hypothetical protein [Corynebacterium breve]WIM66850.1 hypothetical protein QP027_06840 [Corynebacterium breve]